MYYLCFLCFVHFGCYARTLFGLFCILRPPDGLGGLHLEDFRHADSADFIPTSLHAMHLPIITTNELAMSYSRHVNLIHHHPATPATP